MSDDDLLARSLRLLDLWRYAYARPCHCVETMRCPHCQTRDLLRDAARAGEWPTSQRPPHEDE